MDIIFLEKVYNFLQLEEPTEEQIIAGARLLLQMNNNRGLYNSTLKRPQYYLKWVRADLQKMYNIRKRGLANADVQEYNEKVVKNVEETLSVAPEEEDADEEATVPVKGIRGKRDDHEELPEEIRNIWAKNAERWKKMRQLHAQLALMIEKEDYQPCDGNELCYVLAQTDALIRNDYHQYDTYAVNVASDDTVKDTADDAGADIKAVQKARTMISRKTGKENLTDSDLESLQDAVNLLHSMKQTIKAETADKLRNLGVAIPWDEEDKTE